MQRLHAFTLVSLANLSVLLSCIDRSSSFILHTIKGTLYQLWVAFLTRMIVDVNASSEGVYETDISILKSAFTCL